MDGVSVSSLRILRNQSSQASRLIIIWKGAGDSVIPWGGGVNFEFFTCEIKDESSSSHKKIISSHVTDITRWPRTDTA
ncbi:hypothetical protein H6P81_000800 [Aristolochia fimbriata]|uniref:Uncharacterized protein n=1 Tax=Aristolochia fimbriata TaxID=158543 RepID=A0AAV7F597_ARIFI|nr:hypothetical protein H6P81_000800 [Aristolochia fimbriata]